jgi:nucleotide-binding universal stress UspA family protein
MIERVLVPLDGSKTAELALPTAAALVRPERGMLILLHALTPPPWISRPAEGFVDREQRKACQYLSRIAAQWRRKGIRVVARVLSGEASSLIVRMALQEEVDLIAISGRGRGGAGGGPLGSVTERVLRTSLVPVLLLRGRKKIRRVLVPLEGGEDWLAVMAAVGETARPLGAKVEILRAGRQGGRALAGTMDVLTRFEIPGRVVVRSGRAARSIEKAAEKMGADLVAVATVSRIGDRRRHLGKTLEELLRRSERPLLVVRRRVA